MHILPLEGKYLIFNISVPLFLKGKLQNLSSRGCGYGCGLFFELKSFVIYVYIETVCMLCVFAIFISAPSVYGITALNLVTLHLFI